MATRTEISDFVRGHTHEHLSLAMHRAVTEDDTIKDLGGDSFDYMEIAMDCEDRFDVSLGDDFHVFDTLKELIDNIANAMLATRV